MAANAAPTALQAEDPLFVADPPAHFRDEVLGRWSSHPQAQRRQHRLFAWLFSGPLLLLVLAAVFVALTDDQGPFILLRDAELWTVGTLAALFFALGGALALNLVARWGQFQRSRLGQAAGSADRRLGLDWWIVAASCVAGLALPLLAAAIPGLPPGFRFLAHLSAALPALGLLAALPPPGASSSPRRNPLLGLLLVAVLALLVLALVQDLSVATGRTRLSSFFYSYLPGWARVVKTFAGTLLLAPLAFLLFVLWRLSRFDPPPVSAVPVPESKWRRLLRWLRACLARARSAKSETVEPPAWLRELLAALPAGTTVHGGPELAEPESTSPLWATAELDFIFGGHRPTRDQAEAFLRFVSGFEESVGAHPEEGAPRLREHAGDLVVEGESGSGRTLLLHACALYATFVRGQRVVLLVPNEQRVVSMRGQFEDYLKANHLHHYLAVGSISQRSVRAWLEQREPLPSILIATLDAFEGAFYNSELRDPASFANLRRLLLLLEVVLVDGFTSFSPAQRSHLPFLIDKHRLVLAAEHARLQTVLAFPPLANIARETVVERFFPLGGGFNPRTNLRELRPRPFGRAWRIELVAKEVTVAVDALALWCLEREMDVLLYRRGIDFAEIRRQKEELLQRSRGQGTLQIVSDLDQPLDPAIAIEAAFYPVAVEHDLCLGLRSRLSDESEPVIFGIAPEGEAREAQPPGVVPIVADRSARALLTSHLRNGLRFLPAQTPVDLRVWGQFGLTPDELPTGRPDHATEVVTALGLDDLPPDEQSAAERVLPYVWLASAETRSFAVDTTQLPALRCELFRDPDTEARLYVGRRDGADDLSANPLAEWTDRTGQHLASADLAHLTEFRLLHEEGAYVTDTVERRGTAVRLVAGPTHGTGDDAVYPVIRLAWETPAPRTLRPQWGGPEFGLQWFHLDAPAEEETGPAAPTEIHAQLLGRFDDFGRMQPSPDVKFTYAATLSALVFEPGAFTPEESTAAGAALVSAGADTAGASFCPALTGALDYAFRLRLPGFHWYARCAAHAAAPGALGPMTAWIIEPCTSGRTASRALHSVLRSSAERANFFRSVAWFLEQLACASKPEAFLRRFARTACTTALPLDRLDECRRWADTVVDRAAER